MATIVLKIAKRDTTVTRTAVRKAVNDAYDKLDVKAAVKPAKAVTAKKKVVKQH